MKTKHKSIFSNILVFTLTAILVATPPNDLSADDSETCTNVINIGRFIDNCGSCESEQNYWGNYEYSCTRNEFMTRNPYTTCGSGQGDIKNCKNKSHNISVGQTGACILTINQTVIDECGFTTENIACAVSCGACISSGNLVFCATCAACLGNLASKCTGCGVYECLQDPHASELWAYTKESDEGNCGG